MSSAVKQGQSQSQGTRVNRSLRQHIVEEQGGYCLDAARVEEQLRLGVSSLEFSAAASRFKYVNENASF